MTDEDKIDFEFKTFMFMFPIDEDYIGNFNVFFERLKKITERPNFKRFFSPTPTMDPYFSYTGVHDGIPFNVCVFGDSVQLKVCWEEHYEASVYPFVSRENIEYWHGEEPFKIDGRKPGEYTKEETDELYRRFTDISNKQKQKNEKREKVKEIIDNLSNLLK